MPLEPVPTMMRRAVQERYAIGYFESWNLESLQGVLDAAEATQSPVIIGFNGMFLGNPRPLPENLAIYGSLGRAAAEAASVPCGFIFNECPRDDWVRTAITAGFNLVMLADPEASPADLASRVAAITAIAQEHGVAVEGEVGELPCAAEGEPRGGSMTDPDEAAAFVDATGVDLLAVSVGNVHIRTEGQGGLDLERLEQIKEKVNVPLVLHGGTGISADSLKNAIVLGVAKVNYGTYLKQAYLAAIRSALDNRAGDPHRLLGIGGPEDVLVAGRRAVREAVLERIEVLGCVGKAREVHQVDPPKH
jgi:ketose-bisphosphate aldolase